jgi:hypothetical protein
VTRTLKIDDTDRAIIGILQIDGRRPYAEIAAEPGLAPSTVQELAGRLIESGLLKMRNDHLLGLISDKIANIAGVREVQTFLYLRVVENTNQWKLVGNHGQGAVR